jgi:omega-6 fatty acid desaturase (delta-12 desaturase)
MMPERIVVQPFSLGWYFSTARKCKLFCFEKNTWTDFKGQPTAA